MARPTSTRHRREALRYLETQIRSASPEYVFGILNEELVRLLLSLCVEPSSNVAPGDEEELIREKVRLVLEELIRGMESRVGPPFGDLARCYKSIEALLGGGIDEDRRAQLRQAAGMLIDLSSHVRKAVESSRR